MAVSTDYKRLFIRGLAWDAADASATLYNTLKAASRAQLTKTASGKVLVSHTGNGTTSTYALPSSGDVSPSDVAELCEEMLRRYEEAAADLGGTPTDSAILTEILSQLAPVRSCGYDFSQLSPV